MADTGLPKGRHYRLHNITGMRLFQEGLNNCNSSGKKTRRHSGIYQASRVYFKFLLHSLHWPAATSIADSSQASKEFAGVTARVGSAFCRPRIPGF